MILVHETRNKRSGELQAATRAEINICESLLASSSLLLNGVSLTRHHAVHSMLCCRWPCPAVPIACKTNPFSCYFASKFHVLGASGLDHNSFLHPSLLPHSTAFLPRINFLIAGAVATDMTSFKAERTAEEGARTPYMLTQMTDLDKDGVSGSFFRMQKIIAW